MTTLQYHSKRTNISYRNYFADSFHCRKYFAVLIYIRCTKIFAKLIFVALNDYENILPPKISRFTVIHHTHWYVHNFTALVYCKIRFALSNLNSLNYGYSNTGAYRQYLSCSNWKNYVEFVTELLPTMNEGVQTRTKNTALTINPKEHTIATSHR